MTKATQFLTFVIPLIILYLLLILRILPIPLLSPETSAAILPIVRRLYLSSIASS